MAKKTFWENTDQARDRLRETFVMFGSDPFYVRDVMPVRGSSAVVIGDNYRTGEKSLQVPLDHDDWNLFRVLPPLGWVNLSKNTKKPRAVHLRRISSRTTKHGLVGNRMKYRDISSGALIELGDLALASVFGDPAYHDCIDGNYPTLDEALDNLSLGSSAAISSMLAVERDISGIFWMFRGIERIGILNKNCIRVFPTAEFYREELIDEPNFTLTTIEVL